MFENICVNGVSIDLGKVLYFLSLDTVLTKTALLDGKEKEKIIDSSIVVNNLIGGNILEKIGNKVQKNSGHYRIMLFIDGDLLRASK